MQELTKTYPNVSSITGNPERAFYHFLKESYNKSAQNGKEPDYDNEELKQLLGQIRNFKGNPPIVSIENADVCAVQIASVNDKPTVFLANFSGLKGNINANQLPAKDVIVTFSKTKRKAHVVLLPFMGKPQIVKGEWKKGNLKVVLPDISRGVIVMLE